MCRCRCKHQNAPQIPPLDALRLLQLLEQALAEYNWRQRPKNPNLIGGRDEYRLLCEVKEQLILLRNRSGIVPENLQWRENAKGNTSERAWRGNQVVMWAA